MKNYPEQEAKDPNALASLDWKRTLSEISTSLLKRNEEKSEFLSKG